MQSILQIVIHLMEVGRLGVKFGIEPPTLIKLEMSLEEPLAPPAKGSSTLDEKVLHGGCQVSHLKRVLFSSLNSGCGGLSRTFKFNQGPI